MIEKRKLMWIGAGLAILVVAITIFVNTPLWKSEEFRKKMGWRSYGMENHATYHQCELNRDCVESAKGALARTKGLTNGSPVTLEDIIPFVTNSQYYFTAPGAPAGSLPPCPSGGKYSINPIGSKVVCSHPYHQWYNCMWKTDRSR